MSNGLQPTSLPTSSPKPRTALVLYGSETGNAQDVAEEVSRLTTRFHFSTTVLGLDGVHLRDLLKYTVVIFVISTTGQGEFTQNARAFWKMLLSGALRPGVLRKLRFASFGLGDSSYPKFNVAHRMLHGRLLQLGAQPFCVRGEGNEQHPEGHSAGFREWIMTLRSALYERFPLSDGVEPIAEDVFLEPMWKLQLAVGDELPDKKNGRSGKLSGGRCLSGDHPNMASELSVAPSHNAAVKPRDLPSPDLLPVQGSHIATLLANARVTLPDHFQDVRLLDLRIEGQLSYGPGAVAVLHPKNFPSDVQDFIDLMDWNDIADEAVNLVPMLVTGIAPSPLRHIDLSSSKITVRWLLENVVDIMSIPRRSFFANLVYFVNLQHADGEYQKERLVELANPELIDELWDYTTRPKRTVLEVMSDFTTVKIPWQFCLTVLPIMRGRQFSIASGGDLKVDKSGRTRLELLVAIANPPSPIIKYRRRYGVCTRYISTLQPGQQISVGMHPGYLDTTPDDMGVPFIMVGPGTGVAPIRSLAYQRVQWSNLHGTRPPQEALLGDMLFFGCRSNSADHFFRDEWVWAESLGLKYYPAFSRDIDQPRKYVQDQLRACGAAVYHALVEQRGQLFVCGSSGNMPKGVREAVIDILAEHGKMARAEAEGMVERMEKEGKYKQETW